MLHHLAQVVNNIRLNPLPHVGTDSNKVQSILNTVFALVAAISVLIITISGFRYILSRGDPSSTAKAKNAIIYASVGLIVCVAAFAIVTFVLGSF